MIMHYMMIVLGLLQERPQMYDQLINSRTLLQALEAHARELKANHEDWQDRLWQTKPNSEASQVKNEALEIALKELEDHLLPASPLNETTPLSLDAAMTFIRHTPPA
jgi:hypothetical protein